MNMEHEEKIRLLLSMQENPNHYSDEQLHQMLADDPELAEMLDQLALTKRAFAKQEADDEAIPVDEEWQNFSAAHFEREVPTPRLPFYKLAASFIGILLTIGVAFAAVHIVRTSSNCNPQTVQSEDASPTKPAPVTPTDTIKADSAMNIHPVTFDNVPLEKMLPQIATYYHKEVEFQDTDARQLRFYFEWKPDEGLDATLHRLNLFESVNIELKSDKIVVE